MILLPEIDENKTASNVEEFFTSDVQQLKRSGNFNVLLPGSPTISDLPTGGTYGNSSDEKITKYIDSKELLEKVIKAIDNMPNKYGDYLKYRYLQDLEWYVVGEKTPYTVRQGQNIIHLSYLWFADAFVQTHDFRVYLD